MGKTKIDKNQAATETEMQDLSQKDMVTTTYDMDALAKVHGEIDTLNKKIKKSLEYFNQCVDNDALNPADAKKQSSAIKNGWKDLSGTLDKGLSGSGWLGWDFFHQTMEKFLHFCQKAKYCIALWLDEDPYQSPTYSYISENFGEYMKKDSDGDLVPRNKLPNKNEQDKYASLNERLCKIKIRQETKTDWVKKKGEEGGKEALKMVSGSIPVIGGFVSYGLERLFESNVKKRFVKNKMLSLGPNPTVERTTWNKISKVAADLYASEENPNTRKKEKYTFIDLDDEED